MTQPSCRNCGRQLGTTFVDLGVSPLSNSYVLRDRLDAMEPFYPLHAYVCEHCFLVQLQAFETPEHIFTDYAYFSSYSDSWLEHSKRYVAHVSERLNLRRDELVVEIASNDGYLLQYFKEFGQSILGVEPAKNVAETAIARGIPTESVFLGVKTATELRHRYGAAALIVANNVIAHVPDLHDFVGGFKVLLAPGGTITVEFPHLLRLIESVQFDTIYHEHFSYLSLLALEQVIRRHHLGVLDVEELATHGGSLRVWMVNDDDPRPEGPRVAAMREQEAKFGLGTLPIYTSFTGRVQRRKREVLRFLLEAKEDGKRVAGYGAPAKGNTLLNYCGVRDDLVEYTVDRNPHKQGTYLPGSRIPVYAPDHYKAARPDYVFILPWNICDEVVEQMADIAAWGGKFVVGMPALRVLD